MISLHDFGRWISSENSVRVQEYSRALSSCIDKNSVVLDLGSGTGIFSLIAARLGARKVYAVEPSPFIELGKELIADNGYCDVVECIPSRMQDCQLPEIVDVIITDVHGVLPWHHSGLEAFLDARNRFLKPAGRCIPESDTIHLGLIAASSYRDKLLDPWLNSGLEFDFSKACERALHSVYRVEVDPDEVATKHLNVHRLDYASFKETDLRIFQRILISEVTEISGFILWFDSNLGANACFSNAPKLLLNPKAYGQLYFALKEPLEPAKGDILELEIRADFINDDYVWTWKTTHQRQNGVNVVSFSQSTFEQTPIVKNT